MTTNTKNALLSFWWDTKNNHFVYSFDRKVYENNFDRLMRLIVSTYSAHWEHCRVVKKACDNFMRMNLSGNERLDDPRNFGSRIIDNNVIRLLVYVDLFTLSF